MQNKLRARFSEALEIECNGDSLVCISRILISGILFQARGAFHFN